MNTPGDDLFLLIKSLSASEKRYFKLFANRHGDEKSKTYLKVFDLIDGQGDVYDEPVIKTKLKSAADIKMLAQMKIYLRDMIMKSMRVYRSEKDVAIEVFELIQDELFYTEKGLTDLRVKAMRRAKELAYTHDLMYLLLAIIQRERIYALKYTGGDPIQKIEDIHTEEITVLQHLNNEADLGRISYALWAQSIIDPLLNDRAILNAFKEYKSHPLLQDYASLKTFMEKMSFLRSHSLICKLSNDVKGYFEFNKKIVELFNDYPQHKFNVNLNYIDALANYLAASHKSGIYDEFEDIIDKLNVLPKDKIKDAASIAISVVNNKLLYIMNTGKFYLSDSVIAEFEDICSKYKKLITESFFLINNYNISVMLFVKNDFSQALTHCLRVIDMKSNARKELQHGAQLMQLILHYELGNKVFLDSLCRNTIRNMTVEKRYHAFEKMFCSYIKKLTNAPKAENLEIIKEMFEQFMQMKRDTPENIYVFMTEILAWCKSKLSNKPLVETIYYKYE